MLNIATLKLYVKKIKLSLLHYIKILKSYSESLTPETSTVSVIVSIKYGDRDISMANSMKNYSALNSETTHSAYYYIQKGK